MPLDALNTSFAHRYMQLSDEQRDKVDILLVEKSVKDIDKEKIKNVYEQIRTIEEEKDSVEGWIADTPEQTNKRDITLEKLEKQKYDIYSTLSEAEKKIYEMKYDDDCE